MRRALPDSVVQSLERQIGHRIDFVESISGGDVSTAFRVELEGGSVLFLKRGAAAAIVTEMEGLAALSRAESGLIVPHPLTFVTDGVSGYLATDWLEAVPADRIHWESLGQRLAALHRNVRVSFGFSSDNFIGRLRQQNTWADDWVDFFVECRLMPQVEMARERHLWRAGWRQPFQRLRARLGEILPAAPEASLVHGDLWGGNAMATKSGPAVFDPAVYYGHREVDLAMTELFGGFSKDFYRAYDDTWPRDAGSRERAEIYSLYHLLNHLNHFGTAYEGRVDGILRHFA